RALVAGGPSPARTRTAREIPVAANSSRKSPGRFRCCSLAQKGTTVDFTPPLADRFIFGGSPHRLRPGTSPHALRMPSRDGHPGLWRTATDGFRYALAVRLSPSCPAFAFVIA